LGGGTVLDSRYPNVTESPRAKYVGTDDTAGVECAAGFVAADDEVTATVRPTQDTAATAALQPTRCNIFEPTNFMETPPH
jgi:hypothetical protein